MKVHIYYRSDLYDPEHEKHYITDRMIHIEYDVFSPHKIAKDAIKYMKDNELVINVIFEYDLPFFDDGISKEMVKSLRNDIIGRKKEDPKQ